MPPTQSTPTPAEAAPTAGTPTGGDNTTLLGVLAYLGPLVIVSHLMGKDNPFVVFHTKQGMVLFAIELAIYIVSSFMFYGFFFLAPILGLVNLGCFILSIVGIINVVQKEQKPLPVIGGLSKHIPF
jgi:uncharacterized membrane protein